MLLFRPFLAAAPIAQRNAFSSSSRFLLINSRTRVVGSALTPTSRSRYCTSGNSAVMISTRSGGCGGRQQQHLFQSKIMMMIHFQKHYCPFRSSSSSSSIRALSYHQTTAAHDAAHTGLRRWMGQRRNKPFTAFRSSSSSSSSLSFSRLPLRNNNINNKTHSFLFFPGSPLSFQLGAVTYFSSSLGGGGGGRNNRPHRPSSSSSSSRPWAQGSTTTRTVGLIGAASLLLGKGKYVLGALKLTKFASLGSMLLSIGTYSMFFGLPYAAGMVGLLLVHETGHALVMMQRGIPFSPMVFMPFVGAVVAMRHQPRDAWEDALVALGGPALGSVGAGVVAFMAHATESQLFFALADFGFMINLFNLLPIGILDGGRVASALSPYAGLAGLALGGYMAYTGVVQNPIFFLILLAGGYETFQRLYNPTAHLPPNYYNITLLQRSVMTASYFGLVAALLTAMSVNQLYRKPPEVLMRERQAETSWDMR